MFVNLGLDLHRSHLDSNSSIHHISNFSPADLHEERQSAVSIASPIQKVWFHSGLMWTWDSPCIILYCPPGRREPWWSCPKKTCV